MNTAFLVSFVITVILLGISIVFCEKRWSGITWLLAVLGLLTMLVTFGVSKVEAQEQEPYTSVWAECWTAVDENTLRVNIVYTSTGGDSEVYTAQVVSPEGANQLETSIPETFSAVAGDHDLGYIELHSEDSPYTFILRMVQVSTGIEMDLPFNTWETNDCVSPEYIPSPNLPTPEPIPTAAPVVSTGRTCVVKYLPDNAVVLVCSIGG